MNINPTVRTAQPSFQAKIKDNALLKEVISDRSENDQKYFQKLTSRLDNISKGDVLEIKMKDVPIQKYGKTFNAKEISIENPKKKGAKHTLVSADQFKYNDSYKWDFSKAIFDFMEDISIPKTEITEKMLTEPAKKDPRSLFARVVDKVGSFLPADDPWDRPIYPMN